MSLINAHTHSPSPDAIVSIQPGETLMDGFFYSVGIHPWSLGKQFDIEALDAAAADSRVVAIGETGLDALASAPMDLQEHLFRHHIALSERLKKPLVIHCVRAHEQLLGIYREMHPVCPWIFHGFRLKPTIARMILDAGIYLSLGANFNRASARLIPADRLLLENDADRATDIRTVAAAVAAARNQSVEEIIAGASANLQSIIRQSLQDQCLPGQTENPS